MKIGLNGFGRIGRTIFRANNISKMLDIKVVNDVNNDTENLAYLLKYDSIHGVLKDEVTTDNNSIIIGNDQFITFSERKISNVPWNDFEIDVIIDCTGSLKNVTDSRNCLGKSVSKIIITDSPDGVDYTMVIGVNETGYDFNRHSILSSSICDVVGSAPVYKIIDEELKIKFGYLLTLHPWLSFQNTMDSKPNASAHLATPHSIGRASPGNLIPKNTSLVKALYKVMPGLKGKLKGMSYRVPTDLVASSSATFILEKNTNLKFIKELIKLRCKPPILDYNNKPLVSVDYKHHKSSCIVDGTWLELIDGNILRVVTWYDNEWGYSSRVLDIAKYVTKSK